MLEEITDAISPKKNLQRLVKQEQEREKEATILCVTKPAEQVPVPSPPATTSAIDLKEPLPGTPSPQVLLQHTYPPNDAIAQSVFGIDLQKIFDELQAQRYTLQSLEDHVHKQFMELQAMQDLQAAQIAKL